MSDFNLIYNHPSMFVASVVSFVAFVAEAVVQPEQPWKELTVTGLLLAAVLYLVRETTRLRDKAEKDAKEREDRYTQVVKANTEAMSNMVEKQAEQVDYSKTVLRAIVDKVIEPKM